MAEMNKVLCNVPQDLTAIQKLRSMSNSGSLDLVAKPYNGNKFYLAGAVVYVGDKLYLANSSAPITGDFDATKWEEVSIADLNKFRSVPYTIHSGKAVTFDFSQIMYNPFLKLVWVTLNIGFNSAIQTSFNMSEVYFDFGLCLDAYTLATGLPVNSGGGLISNPSSVACFQSGQGSYRGTASFWTNGMSNVYGVTTCTGLGYMHTERDSV